MKNIIELIKEIRVVRAEMGVHPAKKTRMFIETPHRAQFEKGGFFIQKFGFAESVEIGPRYEGETQGTVQVVTGAARAFIPMNELVDREKEAARLNKDLAACEKEIAGLEGRLNNQQFVSKAPAQVVEGERVKLTRAREKKQKILDSLEALG